MNNENEASVRQVLNRMGEMFTNPTYELFSELFTEDCDYITFDGRHLKGIKQNYDAHRKLASLWIFKRVRLHGEEVSIRFTSPGTAVVIMKGALVFRWQKKALPSRMSINTNILVRDRTTWKISSFQNTRIKGLGFFERMFG